MAWHASLAEDWRDLELVSRMDGLAERLECTLQSVKMLALNSGCVSERKLTLYDQLRPIEFRFDAI